MDKNTPVTTASVFDLLAAMREVPNTLPGLLSMGTIVLHFGKSNSATYVKNAFQEALTKCVSPTGERVNQLRTFAADAKSEAEITMLTIAVESGIGNFTDFEQIIDPNGLDLVSATIYKRAYAASVLNSPQGYTIEGIERAIQWTDRKDLAGILNGLEELTILGGNVHLAQVAFETACQLMKGFPASERLDAAFSEALFPPKNEWIASNLFGMLEIEDKQQYLLALVEHTATPTPVREWAQGFLD